MSLTIGGLELYWFALLGFAYMWLLGVFAALVRFALGLLSGRREHDLNI